MKTNNSFAITIHCSRSIGSALYTVQVGKFPERRFASLNDLREYVVTGINYYDSLLVQELWNKHLSLSESEA